MTMNNDIEPAIGNWYQDLADGATFQVVSTDEDEAMVELQYFDGDIEEVTLDEWRGMELEATDAPEDWSGPIDDLERDDQGFSETRSEGERRGLAEARRSADLQNPDLATRADTLDEQSPPDEERESEVIRGTRREARNERDRLGRNAE